MNGIQTAIARSIGVYDQMEAMEAELTTLGNQNALLERAIEDLDYIGLFENSQMEDVIPTANRLPTIQKLRRLRAENPLAKQSVRLILRFTLGKGLQYIITSDSASYPNKPTPISVAPTDPTAPKKPVNPFSNVAAEDVIPFPGKPPVTQEPVQSPDGADEIKTIWSDFWSDDDNELIFTKPKAMKKWLDDVVTDGEYFFAAFTSPAAPYVKLTKIPIAEIKFTVHDPDNWARPVYYQRNYQPMRWDGAANRYVPDGNPVVKYYRDWRVTDEKLAEIKDRVGIPASQLADDNVFVLHVMINEVSSRIGTRGVSELFASREWFRVFKEFMEARAAINQAANAISYKRKISAGPTAVASLSGTLGGVPMGYDATGNSGSLTRKLTKPVPAAIYDRNEAVDLEWMKTDTGAVNAEKDAHTLLMVGGAGVGINSHYYGEGGDANLATAQAMELPMVKSFEDWQDFVGSVCLDFVQLVLRVAVGEERFREELKRFSFIFPPIITQDVVKSTTAWTQVVASIAPGNHVVQEQAIRGVLTALGVPNIDNIMPEIMADMQRAELEKQARQQAMIDAIGNNPGAGQDPNAPSQKPPARNGTGNAMDPQLKMLVKGQGVPPARNGRKPPRATVG